MPVDFSISIPGRELAGSGSIMVHANESILFKVANLSFTVSFETTDDKKSEVKTEFGENETSARIKLLNFDNTLGIAWAGDLAIINGRKLRAAFFVHTLGETGSQTRVLSYTFSLGEAVNA